MKRIVLLVLACLAIAADAPDALVSVCQQKAAEAEKAGSNVVAGKDGWLFLANELHHVAAAKPWVEAEKPDPLEAILDFKRQLDKAGIELIIVPVPPKAVVYSKKLVDAPARGRADSVHQQWYETLRKNGVEVLDLTDDFLRHGSAEKGDVYCKQDTHWSGIGCIIAAERIAAEVKKRKWFEDIKDRFTYRTRESRVTITGDLLQMQDASQRDREEKVLLRTVGADNQMKRIEPRRTSPVILLGDSHNLVFHAGADMHAEGAGLPDQLGYELGFPVDLVATRGSGATPARVNLLRRARQDVEYLKAKKMVIWCLSAREFTESKWDKVPVIP